MTENEAKAVKFIENIKDHAVVTLDHIAKEEPNVSPLVYKGREEKANTILTMIEELKQYRAIGTLEELITAMKYVRLAKAHRTVGRAIEECAKYEEIGTPEECRAAVEICKSMIERNITPENMEEYMKFEDECVKDGFTFNSLLEAREKQTAKKIVRRKAKDEDVESELRDFITRKGMIYRCPTCGCCIAVDEMKSCFECGQKLDWSDEEYE